MAVLLQNQAWYAVHMRKSEETFAGMREEFADINRRLRRLEQMLADLPEAVRQKVGFRPPA